MRKTCLWTIAIGLLAVAAPAKGDAVTFTLLTDPNNKRLLPQPKGLVGVSGDHLLRTADDITGSTFNPQGAFTFNLMNPIGIWEPDYPPGYAEGIHSMTGAAFELFFDWFFDTPYAGSGGIDMTFNNYRWNGFIIPVSQLTPPGMDRVTLDDPLGFFGGSSADFETWLLNEVKPTLPADATWLLFAQGTAHPAWTNPQMGMTTDGLVDQTVLAYTTIPEPATGAMLLTGALCFIANRPRRKSHNSLMLPGA